MGTASTTSATPLRLFVGALADLGVEWEPILRGCGVDPAVLQDSEARIPQGRFARIWRAAAEFTGDPCIGLHAGERVHPRAVNIFGYLLMSSAIARQGLERVARYQGVIAGVPWISIDDSVAWVRIRVGMEQVDEEVRAIHAEYVAPLVLGFLSWVTGTDVKASEARFRHDPRGDPAEYTRILRCPVKFVCDRSEVLLSVETLDRPSLHANEEIARVHEDFAARSLLRVEDSSAIAQVKKVLVALLEVGPRDLKSVARRLHTPRTLQRRLAEEGTTFQDLLGSLRRELALHHLHGDDTPIAEIAYLTGFAEVSAFTRAVRRWVGRSPMQYRRERGG